MNEPSKETCKQAIQPIRDTLYVLEGKWKLPILVSLMFEKKRFRDFEQDMPKISPRMLSKELKELEKNGLIERSLYEAQPKRIDYSITSYGKTLKPVINALKEWGEQHRKKIMEIPK